MDVRFVASVSPVVADGAAALRFYAEGLGLSFEGGQGDYVFTERLDGVTHFGLWPLADAAQACFGTSTWPAGLPSPQASIEFEVDDVAAAAQELEDRGCQLLHGARTEPWTQVVARLLSPDGLLVGVCYTPWLHDGRGPDAASMVDAFRGAVAAAEGVLGSPRLASQWDEPSALADMSIGAVAAHLVRAVTTVETYLARPAPHGSPISPADYFREVLGDPSDLASPQNTGVRRRAQQEAMIGHQELLRRWAEAVTTTREQLAVEPPGRLVAVAKDLVLTLSDYLATRIVELLVHSDDLAVSLGTTPPAPPPDAAKIAEQVLLDIARHRHGDLEVLRALTRRERARGDTLRVL